MQERNPGAKEKLSQRYPFIAVVGPVGIGKTTFTELLVEATGITQFQEPYEENPYLQDFYTGDPTEHSFDSQMFFLANKGVQVKRIKNLSATGPVIQDPGIAVDYLIAQTQWKMGWMNDTEHATYGSAFSKVFRDCLKPDVYIALKASENTVIKRIVERGREMELTMLSKYPEYFPKLAWEFEKWITNKQQDPRASVIVIDAEKFDFAKDEKGKKEVLREVINWSYYYLTASSQRNLVGSDGAKLILPDSFRIAPHMRDRVPGKTKIF